LIDYSLVKVIEIVMQSYLGLWAGKFLETSGEKFPEIYSNLARNFRKFVNYRCQSAVSKSSIAKWRCKI